MWPFSLLRRSQPQNGIQPMEVAKVPLTGRQKAVGGTAAIVATILGLIFAHEGGYVNNPNDPGGETNHGCTIAVARANGYKGPMKTMPKAVCQDILDRVYIKRPGFTPIVEREPVLAYEIIDTGVNAGPARAKIWFQASLNTFSRGGRDYPKIAVDGQIGPATLRAYDSLVRRRGPKKACELMVKSADHFQAAHYTKLCEGDKLSDFCVGWYDTRIGNAPIEKCGTGGL